MSRISFVVAAHGKCSELDNLIGSLRTQLEYVEFSGPRGERFRYKTSGQLSTDDIEIVVSWDGHSNGRDYHNVRQITNPKAEVPCTGHNTFKATGSGTTTEESEEPQACSWQPNGIGVVTTCTS